MFYPHLPRAAPPSSSELSPEPLFHAPHPTPLPQSLISCLCVLRSRSPGLRQLPAVRAVQPHGGLCPRPQHRVEEGDGARLVQVRPGWCWWRGPHASIGSTAWRLDRCVRAHHIAPIMPGHGKLYMCTFCPAKLEPHDSGVTLSRVVPCLQHVLRPALPEPAHLLPQRQLHLLRHLQPLRLLCGYAVWAHVCMQGSRAWAIRADAWMLASC